MGNPLRSCLSILMTLTMSMTTSVFAFAETKTPLCSGGQCNTGTKTFVPEACDSASIKAKLNPIDPKKSEHEKAAQACHDEVKKSDLACQPGTNPNAQQAQGQANQYTQQSQQQSQQAAGSGSGQSNNCGGFGDLMKNMKPPMEKYNADCEAARGKCTTSCAEQSKKSQESCASITDIKKKDACQANAKLVAACNKQTVGACQKYSQQADAIIAALANAVMQMISMQQCQEDQGLDCTKDPSNPQCLKDDTVNCADAKHYQNPTCICQVNPNAPGCPGADASRLEDIARRDPLSTDSPMSIPNSPAGTDSSDLQGGKRGPGAGPQAGGGGAGMGSGSGGGRGAADGGQVPTGAKASNPDVLAGDYGGGGGGGRGALGGGYPEVPGGGLGRALKNADLRRATASQGLLTGANGRSNWQKVRERYRDNRGSLLEQGK